MSSRIGVNITDRFKTNALARLRIKAGLKQKEVADAMGIVQPAVSFWESGAGNPSTAKIHRLAELYGVSVQEIINACMDSYTEILRLKEALDNDETLREHIQNMPK